MSVLTAHHSGAGARESLAADELRDLMRLVNRTTEQLQRTHTGLQEQVARLQRELAEANAALRRSQALAALGEMAAGIAHEVRNPLGSIQLYVQMLAEDLRQNPAQAELCAKIDRAVVGLDAIVRDVLAFARNMTIRPEPTTSDELLDRAVMNCHSLLNSEIDVKCESGSSQRLSVDVTLVTQALSNVIRNAIEAMNEAGVPRKQLRLSAARRRVCGPDGRHEQRIVLRIEDSGPGIPADVMPRIFNPFFTTRKTGTGLGLAIVHRIIDAHGGHIHIESIQSGGTGVEFRLPFEPPSTSHAACGLKHTELELEA